VQVALEGGQAVGEPPQDGVGVGRHGGARLRAWDGATPLL
jgi:hypothetical protein